MALAVPLPTLTQRRRAKLFGVPIYWHFLSLDAPTVAVLWAWSFTHAAQIHTSASALAVLGIGTWLIYVTDRLLDGHAGRNNLRERHFFHARHRRPFLITAAAATLALLGLISIMPPTARCEDTLLFAVSMLYFAVVHLPIGRIRPSFPRELTVGVLFACATAVPAWSQPESPHPALVLLILLFAGLCCLNCLAIEIWERPLAPTRISLVTAIAICVAGASATVMFAPNTRIPGQSRLAAAALVSAIVILALDRVHRRFARQHAVQEETVSVLLALRIAADAALLTPLLFVLPWRG